ncbi:MAG TPA: C39 family peptidase [Candidatus Woesebacteria bacterium]|nr:C39 family peptidase [Candidatus Woesebacteria bacterium]
MKWKVTLLLVCIIFLIPKNVFATTCDADPQSISSDQLDDFIKACESSISANQSSQATLKQTITTLNSKINLAQAQINRTQAQIKTLEKEVDVLDGVLETVTDSMDQLEKIYLARVRESYKQTRVTSFDLIFSSDSIGDYFNKVKYLNTIKTKDQLILAELEKSRLDYDQRKTDKVAKQKEVEALKAKLVAQKNTLNAQQAEKQKVLILTQNDEKRYQTLLAQASALVAAMRGFTSGATPLSNQTHCDGWGCYYSQRDSIWFSQIIGNSRETVGRVGCLITSTAMIASHYGKNIKPSDIAASTNPFFPSTAYMNAGSWTVNGVTVNRQQGMSSDAVDNELNAGRPIIAGLNTGYGTHFIVIKGKNGDGYIMNDPYMENGYDKKFSDTYSTSQIFRFDKVTVN